MKKKVKTQTGQSVAFSEPKKLLSEEIATRKNAETFYSILSDLPNPDPVLKKQGADVQVYRELRTDAKLQAVLGSRKAGVKKYRVNIEENKADRRFVELVEKFISEDLDLYSLIDEILEASEFGYKPFELIWEYNEGYILPTASPKDNEGNPLKSESNGLVGKPPEWFSFSNDNKLLFKKKGELNGTPVPENKFVVARRRATYANPYGEGILAACFWPVVFKKNGIRFWNIFVEKYGMPFLIGKYRQGSQSAEINAIVDSLEAMVQDAVAAFPEKSSVEMIERKGGGSGNQEFKSIADYMDKQISQAILGQNLTSDVSSGSLAAAEVHDEVKEEIIADDARIVERFFNEVFKLIRDINFPNSNAPKLTLEGSKGIDKDLSERDKNLQELGVRFKKDYFKKVYKLEEEDFEIESEKKNIQGKTGPQFSNFEEAKDEKKEPKFKDQEAVDAFVDSFSASDLQELAEEILAPVLKIVRDSNDFSECMEKLSEAYPDLSSAKLEESLQKAIFVSESLGNISNE